MISVLLALNMQSAWATPYGAVDEDGYPSWEDRDLHLWTNVVRVAPQDFESLYNNGGCSLSDFEDSETVPHAPLYYDRNLNVAAVYHSQDMFDTGNFSHDSSDGTSFAERVARFYSESGYVGENIAYGYGSGYNTVFTGWMCSSGHRANIMGDYNELGTGVIGDYMTQDFAAGTIDALSPIAMGLHEPAEPTDSVSFYVDWQDAAAPAELRVILNGKEVPLDLEWGRDTQGVFIGEASLTDAPACSEYYVRWTTAAGATGTFPESGSYTFGDCDDLGWIEGQMCVLGINCASAEELNEGISLVGCTSAPGRVSGWASAGVGLALLAARRPRRGRDESRREG